MKLLALETRRHLIPRFEVEVLAADHAWTAYKQAIGEGIVVSEAARHALHVYERSVRENPHAMGRRVDIIRRLDIFPSAFDDEKDGRDRYRDASYRCGLNLSIPDLYHEYKLALGSEHQQIEASLRKLNALRDHKMPIWRELYDKICSHYPAVAEIPVKGTKDIRHIVHGCTSKYSTADIRYFLSTLRGQEHPLEKIRKLRVQYQVGYHLGWRLSDTSFSLIEDSLGI